MKILLTILLLFGLTGPLLGQSRTEKARERMKGNEEERVVTGLVWSFIEFSVDIMPELFYFRPVYDDEPRISYNPYPFFAHGKSGIRRFNRENPGRNYLLDMKMTTSLPQGARAMNQMAAAVQWNVRYWAFNSGYEYLKEPRAPFAIHQFHIHTGRKFRFIEQGDAAFFTGYRSVFIASDRFDGPELGVRMQVSVWRPVTVEYGYLTMLHTNGLIEQSVLGLSLNRGPVTFSVGHRWLQVAGIRFHTFTTGIGIYLQ